MRKDVVAVMALCLAGPVVSAQQYLVTKVAGGGSTRTPAPALSMPLGGGSSVAVDTLGNVYFVGSAWAKVFKMDRAGILTTVAGNGLLGYSGDGGPATQAQLNGAVGLAVDGAGNVYIGDTGNFRVRKVAVDGTITTVAGDGTQGASGDGGPATSARFEAPGAVAVDTAGNLYIGDIGNSYTWPQWIWDTSDFKVRKVSPDGTITTVAGTGTCGYSGDGGPATSAQLSWLGALTVDAAGNLYIGTEGAIRKVSPDGIITTVAGTSAVDLPQGLAVDGAGSLYIADWGFSSRVSKVAADGTITTVAGGNGAGSTGDGGPATAAQINAYGVAGDAAGNLYIPDGSVIRKVTPDGTITTVAGGANLGDGGPATSAFLHAPWGVALDSAGNLYITDTGNSRVRKVAPDGTIATVAINDQLTTPTGLIVDSSGNLYILDTLSAQPAGAWAYGSYYYPYRILKVAPDGTATMAGEQETLDVVPPGNFGLDSAGNLYLPNNYDRVVYKLAPGGTATVFAGVGFPEWFGDGGPATSAGLSPRGVTVDAAGDLYIVDNAAYPTGTPLHPGSPASNGAIRKVSPDGTISTVARAPSVLYPQSVATDAAGNLYIGGRGVQKLDPSGTITTVATMDSAGTAVDSTGSVYIADGQWYVWVAIPAGTRALLSAASVHSNPFSLSQASATFSILVSNASGAGPTTGTVTVRDVVSSGLTLLSMAGPGWTCSGNTCTRSDALAPAASYPPISVTASVAADAPTQVTNQVTVFGGGSPAATAVDMAVVLPSSVPVLVSPADGAAGVLPAPVLSWMSSFEAASYDVHFGTSSAPPLVANTTETSFVPGPLAAGVTYYWQIAAHGSFGSAASAIYSFSTAPVAGLRFVPVTPCRLADTRGRTDAFGGPALPGGFVRSFAVPQGGCGIPATAQAYALNVTAVPRGRLSYLTLWPGGQAQPLVSTLNSWDGTVVANAAIVPAGADGSVSVFVTDPTDVILDIDGYFDPPGVSDSYAFYSATPCRVADTRRAVGTFGGPALSARQVRDFPIPSSSCGIPASARAYSLNVTAIPDPAVSYLGYLTAWPAGQAQPNVSTLNSWTGEVVANAAIVPAGTDGSISVFATDPADLVLDINGYFAAPGSSDALSFYPVTPCRVADTRGGPALGGGMTRSFSVPASGCNIPATAAAYSLNVTVVPDGPLSYLTAWPAGSPQPFVSTLNSLGGTVAANAAIVQAGVDGAVSVYVTNATHVILDIDGYFAP